MWLWLTLGGCTPVCGTSDFVIAGTGQELYDIDGDGTADLTERCGTTFGSYGLRRADLGLTQILLSGDSDASGRVDFALSTYVLAVADVWFRTDHLEVGGVIGAGSINGSGLHLPGGEPSTLYEVFPLIDAELEVIDRRPVRGVSARVLEDDSPEDWRIRWSVRFGRSPTEVMQTWEGEDWLQIADTIEVGDVLFPPPDWP